MINQCAAEIVYVCQVFQNERLVTRMRGFGKMYCRIRESEPSAVSGELWLVLVLTWSASAASLQLWSWFFRWKHERKLGGNSAKKHQPEHEPHLPVITHLFRCTLLLYVRSTFMKHSYVCLCSAYHFQTRAERTTVRMHLVHRSQIKPAHNTLRSWWSLLCSFYSHPSFCLLIISHYQA